MLDIREFEDMVEDTCERIVDSDCGITNTGVGSVTRTIVEAILSEMDVIQYVIYQAYISKTIDSAEGQDLDDVVSILSVIRKSATFCDSGVVTFRVTELSDTDIEIPIGSIVSSLPQAGGIIYEFETSEAAKLLAGETEVDVPVVATTAGHIYLQPHTVRTINDTITGIAEVDNMNDIVGGIDDETDEELRDRAKEALVKMGRGTCDSIRVAVSEIDGIIDCNVYDMRSGIGTVDIFVVSEQNPMPDDLMQEVLDVIEETKAAGIKATVYQPEVTYIDIDIELNTKVEIVPDDIYAIVYKYINELTIGMSYIENQLDKAILSHIDDDTADVIHNSPDGNVQAYENEIIRPNSITIDGVVYYEKDNEQNSEQDSGVL